jgi:hypothetical protein
MVDGWAGITTGVTASVLAVPFPQAFDGVTVIVPALAPAVTVIELDVPPAVFVQPAGSTQV